MCPKKVLLIKMETKRCLHENLLSQRKTKKKFTDSSLTKDKESFALCYSKSLLLADFEENYTLLWF
jgi:hypothetical protein